MSRTLLLGDTHGCSSVFIHDAFPIAKYLGADNILQVGDFGYWPNVIEGDPYFLEIVSRNAEIEDIPVYFIDGNHEHHDYLDHDAEDFIEVEPGIFYIPRGHKWTWGLTDYIGLGGAFSIDRARRVKHESWFPEEEPNQSQIDRALSAGTADIIVSHDCTRMGFDHLYQDKYAPDSFNRVLKKGLGTRRAIEELLMSSKAKFNVHGHHHHGYFESFIQKIDSGQSQSFTSVGLNLEHQKWAMALVENNLPSDDPNFLTLVDAKIIKSLIKASEEQE